MWKVALTTIGEQVHRRDLEEMTPSYARRGGGWQLRGIFSQGGGQALGWASLSDSQSPSWRCARARDAEPRDVWQGRCMELMVEIRGCYEGLF